MEINTDFNELYKTNSNAVYKLCLGYTGDTALAHDLLQETFITVWNNLNKFRGDSNWNTWIYRITVNTCLSYLRKKKEITYDISNPIFSNLPEEINYKEQEISLLYKSISCLQETDRLIIMLVLEDKPYEEISEIIGISANNLRVKIHRIKKQLTDIYNNYERL